ncbi:hypothetical protein K493DRAFT_313958 [Basidiobolus meristosporus CBS 931.73]|uniref:Uncharacterized protein n=1 Tax=Basidiobolus meristosporus CBS 931.73 TaxID=1314790 RepID=A0A1Y1YIB7_9FUNG|nr:hypothetical protein K493DRAFT_313958 [Basidiobolus meristosporus CBS 931.73]|eukprot:ORX97719.1 hypothetical protein K493DRAFT_313958 [Basidiobolus meristosporus CBS 931.73]
MSSDNLEILDSSYDEHEDFDYVEDKYDEEEEEDILESVSPSELLNLVRDNEEIDEVDKAILLDLARALGEEVDENQDVTEILHTLENLLIDEDEGVIEDLDSEEEE